MSYEITKHDVDSAGRDLISHTLTLMVDSVESLSKLDPNGTEFEKLLQFLDDRYELFFDSFCNMNEYTSELLQNDSFRADCVNLCIIRNNFRKDYTPQNLDVLDYLIIVFMSSLCRSKGKQTIDITEVWNFCKVDPMALTHKMIANSSKTKQDRIRYDIYLKHLKELPDIRNFKGSLESYKSIISNLAKKSEIEVKQNNILGFNDQAHFEKFLILGSMAGRIKMKPFVEGKSHDLDECYLVLDKHFKHINSGTI